MRRPFIRPSACERTRQELIASQVTPRAEERRHIAGCAACAAFADRLAIARESLADHRAEVVPDPSFAARVTAALPTRERDALGRLALHWLPATLALALVLGGWCWARTTSPSELVASAPTDDVLSWVLENGSEQP